ncbi:glycosyltransferase family 39 protein [Aquirufa sp. ROCK2-A2]
MYLLIFISFILLNFKISSKISNKNFEEIVIIAFISYSSSIIISGYLLSFIHQWSSIFFWCILPFFISFLFYSFFKLKYFEKELNEKSAFKITGSTIQELHIVFKQSSGLQKFTFFCIFWTLVLITMLQFSVMLFCPPNEWDSMTGHLNRILYFLQEGSSLTHFIGTNWNIDTYPRSFSSIQVYPFLMNDKQELWFRMPNYISYWILSFSIYGILKRLEIEFKIRLLISSFILLLPITIMQSLTTDTDIVLGAYLGSLLYFIISFKTSQKLIYLYLSGLTFGIALSHKITFAFSLIPLAIIYLTSLNFQSSKRFFYQIKHLLLSHSLGVILFVLCTGYISNYIHYGHPIGPKTATMHQSVERAGNLENLLKQGSRNVFRYTFDLLNPDGLRNIPWVEEFNAKWKFIPRAIDQKLQLGLESKTEFTIIPFSFDRQFEFYNGTPIYGLLFLLVLIPSILIAVVRFEKKYLFFLCAFVIHFLFLCYTAAYDPWKGRYMISSSLYLFPLGIYFGEFYLRRNHYGFTKFLLGTVTVFICVSSLSTLLFNIRALPFDAYGKQSFFQLNRMESLTISRPDITKAYYNFDQMVPSHATVALGTINDDYEYPLWGAEFTRKLIPINRFEQGIEQIPTEADYLFFAKSVIPVKKGDIRLGSELALKKGIIVPGEDYYLRKLK